MNTSLFNASCKFEALVTLRSATHSHLCLFSVCIQGIQANVFFNVYKYLPR